MNPLEVYERMLTIRLLEDELQKLCFEGEAGDLHFSKGQEAISVGVCEALKPTDYIVTHHRTIAHSIAKGVPLKPLVAEVLGKATGVSGGIAGEMHLHYPPARYMFSFQLVGTCIPVSVGLAWASKYYTKTDDIVAVFFGDAATSNGQFHEGMNIAAIKKVPLLVIVEDNHLAGNIRPPYYMPPNDSSTHPLEERFKSYGIESRSIDGNHIDEVIEAAQDLSDEVWQYSKPYALICDTTRMCWHKQGQRDIRQQEELTELAKRDPLLYAEKKYKIDVAQKTALSFGITQRIKEAIDEARQASYPRLQDL